MRTAVVVLLALAFVAPGCQSTSAELSGLEAIAPLDYAVLVTGGAFLAAQPGRAGTFTAANDDGALRSGAEEPIAIEDVVAVLEAGRVFRRVAMETDVAARRTVGEGLAVEPPAGLQAILQRARDDGFDLLLVVEELQDGPIEEQGINGRWPVTFVTWILLGVGALIPDHTFESRATLRISLRDLQSGQALDDRLLTGGPVELALTERTDVLGLLASILVPPFLVGSDADDVRESVRAVTERRLLVSLARELKSASVRQRLRERSAAAISLVAGGRADELRVEAAESLSAVRVRVEPPLPESVSRRFTAALLASLNSEDGRFEYRAALPPEVRGRLIQVLVATIRGAVASATFVPGGGS